VGRRVFGELLQVGECDGEVSYDPKHREGKRSAWWQLSPLEGDGGGALADFVAERVSLVLGSNQTESGVEVVAGEVPLERTMGHAQKGNRRGRWHG
jgi:hypothetical protein